jgi:putative endopeptidase
MGGWIAAHPLPPDRGRYGVFNVVADRNVEISHQILERLAGSADATGDRKKIGDLYASCMDEASIERAGLSPIASYLGQVAAIHDRPSLLQTIASLHAVGIDVFWEATSTLDLKDSRREIAAIAPAGLTLPDRDFYLREDSESVALRDAYKTHLATMFRLAGEPSDTAAGDAKNVLAVETAMAQPQLPRDERRNPDNIYHLLARSDLANKAPSIDWDAYFKVRDFPPFSQIDVSQPKYVEALEALLGGTPLPELQAYMRWRVLATYAPWLPKRFADENFAFTSRLTGTKTQLPRWKRCVSLVDTRLGAALGQAWVERAFPPRAKARAQQMVANITDALREDLESLSWMSEATRRQALRKLAAMNRKIGYPEKWRSYAPVAIDRSSLLADVQNADAYNVAYEVAKIGKPRDPTEFGMTPQTVNAYYSPTRNEIVFPAGILQPPFFDDGSGADDAINYGGIGAVIGHEMTHGFDDQGRLYDEDGNLRNWWTPDDAERFNARAQCIVDQFSAYRVGDLNLNGKLVEGEAIADLGGLTLAYRAFERAEAGKPKPVIDGFTPEQRFFLGFAQIWGSTTSPQLARTYALVDPHPPDEDRVDGTVRNMPQFASAFGCAASGAMVRNPTKRCQIW